MASQDMGHHRVRFIVFTRPQEKNGLSLYHNQNPFGVIKSRDRGIKYYHHLLQLVAILRTMTHNYEIKITPIDIRNRSRKGNSLKVIPVKYYNLYIFPSNLPKELVFNIFMRLNLLLYLLHQIELIQ